MRFRSRKIFSLFLSLALFIGVLLGAVPMTAYGEENVQKLTIVHVNDVHGRVELDERDKAIGYGRIKTKVDELRKENPNLLLLNGGDTVHGTTLVNVTEGETMISLMDQLGFDAMVPGNHDFNYGYERLLELDKLAKFPILAANVVKESDGARDLAPYTIKELDNGLKIGIFGLATEETKYKSHPDNTKGVNIENPIEAAKRSVKALEDEEVDFIIALGHLGIEGTLTVSSRDVVANVLGIDLFVDGHSHELLNQVHGNTLLVQAGQHTNHIGIVDVEIKDGKVEKKEGRVIAFDEAKDYTPDPQIENAIKEIEEINKPIVSKVIGHSKVDLDGERGNVRTKETNLGNLIADAMLKSTEADVAMTNGGGIRASISKGDITVEDILTSFPFTNGVEAIEVKGKDIVAALERGVDTYPDEAGHFPQVSGIKYEFNPKMEVGNRVKKVLVNGENIDLEKTYILVTNDFMAAGGDEYTMFKDKPTVSQGALLSDILMDYFKEVGEIDIGVEERIKIVDTTTGMTEGEKPVPTPSPEPKPETPSKEKEYVVKSGDVLYRIGIKFKMPWEKLAEYNKLKNPNRIYPGQVINIPN